MATESTNEKRARRKRKKRYQSGKPAKHSKGGMPSLSVGMKGVLITTNGREQQCIREAYNLLSEYGDKLYGPEFNDGSSDDASSDINEQIAKEVAAWRDKSASRERRFQSVVTGAKNVVFVACREMVDPNRLIYETLCDVRDTQVQKSRYCCRMIPLVVVSRATLEDIAKHSKPIIRDYFYHEDPIRFAVHCKSRNSNAVSKDDVIKLIASLVTNDNVYPHTADIKNPQVVVCVEVIKSLCCIGVLKDYYELKQYNIQSLTDSTVKKGPNVASDEMPPLEEPTNKKASSDSHPPSDGKEGTEAADSKQIDT